MKMPLPARPSLEQLKKQAKDLVKYHGEKNSEALALIGQNLLALSGKNAEAIAAYPFALHDAQSVAARQYGFPSWNELHDYVDGLSQGGPAPQPDLDVAAKLQTVFRACEQKDYWLFCSVMSEQMKAAIPEERFVRVCDDLSVYLKSDYQVTYMGELRKLAHPVHFWRLWVEGWESDCLVRMALNNSSLISGLLFSDPFDQRRGKTDRVTLAPEQA